MKQKSRMTDCVRYSDRQGMPSDNNQYLGDSSGNVDGVNVARMIELCAAQTNKAMQEAFAEIEQLSRSVIDVARCADAVSDDSASGDSGPSIAATQAQAHLQALRLAALSASAKLQFADRLQQRLSNVTANLNGLADIVRTRPDGMDESRWSEYLQMARATYTMQEERHMFDRIFVSAVDDVEELTPRSDGGDELFDFGNL